MNMEYHSRRNRRGRGRSRPNLQPVIHDFSPPQNAKPWSLLSGVYSLVVMASLIAVIYMMLEYHCETCKKHYDIKEITSNLDLIAHNLSVIAHSYHDLETKLIKLSSELPKLEGQMEVLETLAHSLEPKNDLRKVDIFINPPTKQSLSNQVMDTELITVVPLEVVADRQEDVRKTCTTK